MPPEASSSLRVQVGDMNAQVTEAEKEDIACERANNIYLDEVEPMTTNLDVDAKVSVASTGTTPQIDSGPKESANFSLQCPITKKSHAHLAGFNMATCPACGQDMPANLESESKSSDDSDSSYNSDSSDSSIDEDLTKDEDTGESGRPWMRTTVIFKNVRGVEIRAVRWPNTFNLDETRTNHAAAASEDVAFEVVTKLQTSIHGRRVPRRIRKLYPRRPESGGARGLGLGMLKDPFLDIRVSSTTIKINSKVLVDILKFVVSYYPAVNLEKSRLSIREPFAVVMHHLPQLEGFLKAVDSLDVIYDSRSWTPESKGLVFQQLEAFVQFFKQTKYTTPISEEVERNARGFCTFRMLWHLLRPGCTVYVLRDGILSAHIIAEVSFDGDVSQPGPSLVQAYRIRLWHLDFDGRHVGRCEGFASIPAFEGERAINSLRVFPVEYRDDIDGGETRRELEKMGKEWFGYLLGAPAHYKGEFMGPIGRQFDGRVFIDNVAYIEEHSAKIPQQTPPPPPVPAIITGFSPRNPSPHHAVTIPPPSSYKDLPTVGEIADLGEGLAVCSCDECRGKRVHPPPGFQWTDYDLIDPKTTKSLELPDGPNGRNHRYLLCSRRLFGFVFKSRKWEVLDVKYCSDPRIQPKAIESLVMRNDRKMTIQALVQQYNTSNSKEGGPQRKQWGADHIESKGEGQIFLLHGGPGVGKSLPLLSLNVGDIGTSEENVEDNLSYWFNLAEKWGAVMLIDEADVYLERRTVSDLRRNGIVSVFLRCMEYYRGILFLTTNRIGHFDDAFVSRIHLVIHYEPLGETERRRIWTQFFQKLEDERKDIAVTSRARNYVLYDPEINDVKWNGREIRNAFQTAVALADFEFSAKENKREYETAQLDQKHFQQICGMALQFKGYLTNLHGMDEHGRAFVSKARDDGAEEQK